MTVPDSSVPPAPTPAPTPRPPPPFSPGERRVVQIRDLAFGGEGVARIQDFVVFVPFVIPGETVEVEVTEVHRQYARARLVRVVDASPDRVKPECPYYGACGGCQYQHLAYPAQLAAKHRQITELFRRVGGFATVPIDPVVPCPQPYAYRNRIMVRSQWDKHRQGLVIGFLRHDNRLVVDIESCRIAEPALNEQLLAVRRQPPPKGGLKVMLRLAPEGWDVPPDSFFQNNDHLLHGLVRTVRERLAEGGCRHLVDAYCGVGFFSLELADQVIAYVGIEYDRPAVQAARRNAAHRNRLNGEFLQGTVEDLLPAVLARFSPEQTAVVIDPPRRGCARSAIEFLRSQHPAQILYVSCHPATLARDLQWLTADDVYQLVRVTPLDMFPQTQHVECVADVRARAHPALHPVGGDPTTP